MFEDTYIDLGVFLDDLLDIDFNVHMKEIFGISPVELLTFIVKAGNVKI